MGSLLENNKRTKSLRSNKTLSKGQRLGWVHRSEYQPAFLCNMDTHHEKLHTYTSGPFSLNKLVP